MKFIQKAAIRKEDRYLIGLRSQNAEYFPMHWDFPGGKLEPDEDPLQGIAREVEEETGLKVKPAKILGVYEFDLDNKGENTHHFTIYSAELLFGDLKLSSEHLEQRWATKEEILRLPIEPYFKSFFKDNP